MFTGKAELGQGFKTAFQQIAAEELDVPFGSLKVITADTSRTANEGYTSGSHSMQDSGTAIQNAAAQVRAHCWSPKPRGGSTCRRRISAPKTAR